MTMRLVRRSGGKKKELNDIIDDFIGGTVTQLSDASLGKNMAKQSSNLMQTENGKWTTRWGTGNYGLATPNGLTPDGAYEYVKPDETTELIVVANKVYKSIDSGAWNEILTGASASANFTHGNKIYFLQIKNRLYMTNGIDNLTYYDGTNIVSYSELSAPTWAGTPLARTTLTTGSYNVFYQVTALNDVGETVGSSEQTLTVNKPRNQWTSTEKITLDWNAVSGASRYQVYYSDETGFEVYLSQTTATGYDDTGVDTPNPYVEVPDANTTGAPKFRQMELSGNRIWATNDPNNKYRVYFSGTGQYQGYFSEFYGGGYIDLELGGREMPRSVAHYRTGKGDPVVTVLCSSPEGRGATWQVDLTSATVEDTTFTIPSAIKVIGSIGTSSPLSVVKIGNAIMYANKQGFTVLGSKEGLLNVLSADEASFNIRPDVRSLVGSQIENIAGYFKDGKVFYSVPTSSSGNDRTFIYDTERKNWQIDWSVGFKQYLEYTDTGGSTHFLAVPISGTRLVEISENIAGDVGVAVPTSYISGLYPIERDRTKFAKIDRAYIELGNPTGNISFSLLGTEKGKSFSSLGTVTISTTISQTGMTWDRLTNFKFSNSSGTPTTFSSSSVRKSIRVRKLLNNYQFKVTSSGLNDRYTLLSLQVKGKIINTRDPSQWAS